MEIHRPDPSPVAAPSVPYADFAGAVAAAFADADLGEGEFAEGLAFV
jgi:hypothetical protein